MVALLIVLVVVLAVLLYFALAELQKERLLRQQVAVDLAAAREQASAAHSLRLQHEQQWQSAGGWVREQARASAGEVANDLQQRIGKVFEAQTAAQEQTAKNAQGAIHAQLSPVKEQLDKFDKLVKDLERNLAQETGSRKQHWGELMQATTAVRAEAHSVATALKGSGGVRGSWGEHQLKQVLDLAGMNDHYDFDEQHSTTSEDGRLRPDVVVHLPGGGNCVIDAKVNLNAFWDAQNANDEAQRQEKLARHAAGMKAHVRALAAKAYQDALRPSPDFVVMFVPSDGHLAAALKIENNLLVEAMSARVAIVTPTSLFALFKAVAYGWRMQEQSQNAAKVAELGRKLYERLAVLGGHCIGLGNALQKSVEQYNKFVGSLESQFLTQAKRFQELQVDHEGKEIADVGQIDVAPRRLTRPELTGNGDLRDLHGEATAGTEETPTLPRSTTQSPLQQPAGGSEKRMPGLNSWAETGQALLAVRQHHRWTQADVARVMRTTQTYVSKLENGKPVPNDLIKRFLDSARVDEAGSSKCRESMNVLRRHVGRPTIQ